MPLIALGVLLVAAAAYDVFRSLFDPAGSGALDYWVQRDVWRMLKALSRRAPALMVVAGPLAFVAVVATWVVLAWIGYAFVYTGSPDTAFASTLPLTHVTFGDALSISSAALAAQSTPITPSTTILKLLWSGKSMFGFLLLTSTVSFIVSIYPILERRRTLAHHVRLLCGATIAAPACSGCRHRRRSRS